MSQSTATGVPGTATHIPPEKWKNWDKKKLVSETDELAVKADVYSFSILLWELFANERPFNTCAPGATLPSTCLDA